MEVKDLKPELIWKYFDAITKVPRPSKKEGKIREFLLDFAREHKLDARVDKTGNVVITKDATSGCECAPVVVMQSHMDMVCEKNGNVTHDFDRDSIDTYIDGEWIKARGTTLGADNGIGMAAELAVLASDNLKHGKLQALFTVDEETGLTGAFGMEKGFFEGDYLLNLDSEDEAEIFIGCAGGIDTTSTFTYQRAMAPENYFYLRIDVGGLLGGHSGGDIHLGRGNANKILARFLWQCMKKYDMVLCSIDGGNLRNAIPREATAVIGVHQAAKEDVRADLNHYIPVIEDELSGIEPGVMITMESTDEPEYCIDHETAWNLVNALYAIPHGVIAMSRDIPGLVETSTNLASVKMKNENEIIVATSQRSSVESEKYNIAYQVESVFLLAKSKPTHGDGYPGWKPNMHSRIMETAVAAYEELYKVTPAIKAIHAGLECGLFLQKYPHLDMISFGPTLQGVHSPDEKMHISAVEKFWNHLVRILEKVSQEKKQ